MCGTSSENCAMSQVSTTAQREPLLVFTPRFDTFDTNPGARTDFAANNCFAREKSPAGERVPAVGVPAVFSADASEEFSIEFSEEVSIEFSEEVSIEFSEEFSIEFSASFSAESSTRLEGISKASSGTAGREETPRERGASGAETPA